MVKQLKKAAAALLAAALLLLTPAAAGETPRQLVPVGAVIGIRLETDGLLIIGMNGALPENGGCTPAAAAGLRCGDILTHVGAYKVTSAQELRDALAAADGEISVRFLRDGKEMQATVRPVPGEDGTPELGVWLRSGISGIGTLTWYDPETGAFGALGHAVNDVDTGVQLPLKSGQVSRAMVDSVQRGSTGAPGELKGRLGLEECAGCVLQNTEAGIFGVLDAAAVPTACSEPVPICPLREVRCGEGEVLSDVSGQPEHYAARILRVYQNGGGRDFLIQITDAALIERTGGIVQGMSGSPILQDGRLVGAVTHVLVSDPTKGYGIGIEDMLRASEAGTEAAA